MSTQNYSSLSGYLGIYLGPMFSGKTTRLIQLHKTNTYIGKKVVVINYIADTRYHDTMLSTHDRIMIPCIFIEDLKDAWINSENKYYQEIHDADIILHHCTFKTPIFRWASLNVLW